ncbi:ribbon-helix-helix domain-containing protein [Mycobacterium kansasii]
MTRINVYDADDYEGTRTLAGWFDDDSAESYSEDTRWDGNNHISIPTGSQWEHEHLFRTAGGRWVLHRWSQWQGTTSDYRFVSGNRARDWLLANDHEAAVERLFGPVEPERGPGRPEIGTPINIRLGDELLAQIDSRAAESGRSRSETIRALLTTALG